MLAEKFNSYFYTNFVISTSRSTKSILSVVLGLLKVNPVDETVILISHYHWNKVVARDFHESLNSWVYILLIGDNSILSILNGMDFQTPVGNRQ